MLVFASACGPTSSPPAPKVEATPAVPSILATVGPHPRGYARLSLAHPYLRPELERGLSLLADRHGTSLADCNLDLTHLDRLQVAVGEPLRIAAEVDGKIDVRALTCLLGEAAMQSAAERGIAIRDRPGGLAVEYNGERAQGEPARAYAAELAKRCTGNACATIAMGPAARPLWVQLWFGKVVGLQLSGPSLRGAAAAVVAAVDQLRTSTPALRSVLAFEQDGALIVQMEDDGRPETTKAREAALLQLIEAFKIPSASMLPTLHMNDHVYAVKGPLFGAPAPGDVVIYNFEDRQFAKRYLAGPGQTVTQTADGLAIDGKPLTAEVVDAEYRYRDDDGLGHSVERIGTMVREHLGARSYLVMHTGGPRPPGTWTVPPGHAFLVGDNRNNSNDSRYVGAIPGDAIVGRVVGTWLAYRDDALDWDRMGIPIE
jgi:signal peptidase I